MVKCGGGIFGGDICVGSLMYSFVLAQFIQETDLFARVRSVCAIVLNSLILTV